MIGDCGVSMQIIDDEMRPEIGYHLNKKSWICMVMDERSPVEKLFLAFESSRDIAGKKGKK